MLYGKGNDSSLASAHCITLTYTRVNKTICAIQFADAGKRMVAICSDSSANRIDYVIFSRRILSSSAVCWKFVIRLVYRSQKRCLDDWSISITCRDTCDFVLKTFANLPNDFCNFSNVYWLVIEKKNMIKKHFT